VEHDTPAACQREIPLTQVLPQPSSTITDSYWRNPLEYYLKTFIQLIQRKKCIKRLSSMKNTNFVYLPHRQNFGPI